MTDGSQVSGVIKKMVAEKGYGFITPDNKGKDVFFHARDCRGVDWNSLKEGDRVEFEVVEAEKGLKAVNIMEASPDQQVDSEE